MGAKEVEDVKSIQISWLKIVKGTVCNPEDLLLWSSNVKSVIVKLVLPDLSERCIERVSPNDKFEILCDCF